MMLDSAIALLISLLLALLLLSASLHKFSDRQRFSGILAAYRLLPAGLIPVLAFSIPLVEMVLGLAWLSGWQLTVVTVATAALLSGYTVAIAINLARGNVEIDCGCGFSGHKDNSTGYQRLSAGLLARNGVIIAVALLMLLPSNDRMLGIFDFAYVTLACGGLLLLYAACNQLLANKQRIDSWRTPLLNERLSDGDSHA